MTVRAGPLVHFECEGVQLRGYADIPLEFENVLLADEYKKEGDYSVTQLLDHPRCATLPTLHPSMAVRDPAKVVHATIGTALHEYFAARLKGEDTQTEVSLSAEIAGKNVVGHADLIQYRHASDVTIICDINHWTTYHWRKQQFGDLFWQLQSYWYMYAMKHQGLCRNGILEGFILFRDWNRRDLMIHRDRYPPRSCMLLCWNPLPLNQIHRKLETAVLAHEALHDMPEPEWPDAAPEDVWQETTAFKVYRKGIARAVNGGVFDCTKEGGKSIAYARAHEKLNEMGGPQDAEIREITTARRRCADYCSVSSQCTTYQQWLRENQAAPGHDAQ